MRSCTTESFSTSEGRPDYDFRDSVAPHSIQNNMSNTFLSEANKRLGVHYAVTTEGVELPVVDVTHPAFTLTLSDSEQHARVDQFLQERVPFAGFPKSIRDLLLRFFLRGSVLGQGIHQSQGTFMTGMHTYLLKLGPEMLGSAYAKPIDRKIAASLPVLSARPRLQDMVYLMVERPLTVLSSDPRRPLCFMNIGGGPAIDSLNALIVLNKRQPGSLADQEVSIDVLDQDDAGPKFGGRPCRRFRAAEGHCTELVLSCATFDMTGENLWVCSCP